MWQFQICLQTDLDKNLAPRPANCAGVCMTSREPGFKNMKNLRGSMDGEIWPLVSKIKFHIGYSCSWAWDFQIAFQWMKFLQSIQKKYRGQEDPQGNTPWEATAFSESFGQRPPVFFRKKSGRFVSCAYASNWWTPMVQIHEMSEQIRIGWLQFQHRNSTCRLTSCPHVMFQRASPSVPVPPDVWKALWSLKPPAMSKTKNVFFSSLSSAKAKNWQKDTLTCFFFHTPSKTKGWFAWKSHPENDKEKNDSDWNLTFSLTCCLNLQQNNSRFLWFLLSLLVKIILLCAWSGNSIPDLGEPTVGKSHYTCEKYEGEKKRFCSRRGSKWAMYILYIYICVYIYTNT